MDIVEALPYLGEPLSLKIMIKFSPEAGKRLLRVTAKHLHDQIALVAAGQVLAVFPISTPFGTDVMIDAGKDKELAGRVLEKLLVATGERIPDKGRLLPVPAEERNKIIGHLSWIATETGSNTVVARGDSDIRMGDIQVFDRSTARETSYSKAIRLNDTFLLELADVPPKIQTELRGFGMIAFREDVPASGWDWFDTDNAEHATKLQEGGELRIESKQTGPAWELVYTEFLTDVSFRLGLDDENPMKPKWRVLVLKGSTIRWPSVLDGKLVLN
jgi:hypothetical protein